MQKNGKEKAVLPSLSKGGRAVRVMGNVAISETWVEGDERRGRNDVEVHAGR